MDFDGAEWTKDVAALRAVCDESEISCAVERSRSGNGAHVWFFGTSEKSLMRLASREVADELQKTILPDTNRFKA